MALTSQGFALVVSLVDIGGNKSSARFDLTAADFPTAETDTTTILAALGAVTGMAIEGYQLGEVYKDAAAGFGTTEAENVALITAKIDGAVGKYANIRVPGPLAGIFLGATGPDYNKVDPADADIIAYLSLFETGAQATVSDGEHIADAATSGNWEGKRIHRGSRRG